MEPGVLVKLNTLGKHTSLDEILSCTNYFMMSNLNCGNIISMIIII